MKILFDGTTFFFIFLTSIKRHIYKDILLIKLVLKYYIPKYVAINVNIIFIFCLRFY